MSLVSKNKAIAAAAVAVLLSTPSVIATEGARQRNMQQLKLPNLQMRERNHLKTVMLT